MIDTGCVRHTHTVKCMNAEATRLVCGYPGTFTIAVSDIVDRDKLALAIFKNIADRFDERGHFLQKFAIMFVNASEKNKKCLFPAAHKLIEEYNLEAEQKQKGVLHEAQYM
jgi:hypothetical protein